MKKGATPLNVLFGSKYLLYLGLFKVLKGMSGVSPPTGHGVT